MSEQVVNELTNERREQVARERARLYAGEQLGTAGEDREFLLHLVEVERDRTRKANEAWADEDRVRHEVEAELEYVTRERDAALRATAHVLQMCDDAPAGSVWLSIEAVRATLAGEVRSPKPWDNCTDPRPSTSHMGYCATCGGMMIASAGKNEWVHPDDGDIGGGNEMVADLHAALAIADPDGACCASFEDGGYCTCEDA